MTDYQLLDPLTDAEYKALKADIAERGIIVPVELDEDGNILDGHHRIKAWQELKDEDVALLDYPRVVRAGMTETQKRNHVRALNIIRRQLTPEQRDEQMAAMRDDGMSLRQIADAVGVSHMTVSRGVTNVTPEKVVGKDGKKYPATKKHKTAKPPAAPTVSIFATSEQNEEKAKREAVKLVDNIGGASQPVEVLIFSHESKEYYTPPQYIKAAREVMGGIDLDPASCQAAQKWIKATRHFTIADDGLTQDWHGRVWLNPPYSKTDGRSNQEIWAEKLIAEYASGRVTEAILLVRSALGYKWFENLWYDWPICFAKERISFVRADGNDDGQSKQGTAFLYFGANPDRFIDVFRKFGRVILSEDGHKPLS